MPQQPGVFYDKRAKCWATNSLGEPRHIAKGPNAGKMYRPRSYARHLTHPTKDRRAAEGWLNDQLETTATKLSPANNLTLDQIQEFYLHAVDGDLTPDSLNHRVEQLDRCLGWRGRGWAQTLGQRVAAEVTVDDIETMADALLAEGLSRSYVNDSLLRSLRRLFSWASDVKPGLYAGLPLKENPIAKFKSLVVPRRKLRVVSSNEAALFQKFLYKSALRESGLLRRFGLITAHMIFALRETGARPKELCVAEWSELNVHADGWGTIILPDWKHKTGKKTGRERIVPLPPHVMRRIEWIRALPGRHEKFIFTHKRSQLCREEGTPEAGQPWTWVNHEKKQCGTSQNLQGWFYRHRIAAEAAGLTMPKGFRMYWQRSRFSTHARLKGNAASQIAQTMGTSEKYIEASYSDFDEQNTLSIARLIQGRMNAKP